TAWKASAGDSRWLCRQQQTCKYWMEIGHATGFDTRVIPSPRPQESRLQEPRPQESRLQEPRPQESRLQEPRPQESRLQEPRLQAQMRAITQQRTLTYYATCERRCALGAHRRSLLA